MNLLAGYHKLMFTDYFPGIDLGVYHKVLKGEAIYVTGHILESIICSALRKFDSLKWWKRKRESRTIT